MPLSVTGSISGRSRWRFCPSVPTGLSLLLALDWAATDLWRNRAKRIDNSGFIVARGSVEAGGSFEENVRFAPYLHCIDRPSS